MAQEHNLTCEQLADNIRPFMRTHIKSLLALCFGIALWMVVSGQPGVVPFLIVVCGSLLPICAWNAHTGTSLPLGPLVGVQTLIIYGTPLVTGNPTVFNYPPGDIFNAAIEILIFGASLTAAWWIAFKNCWQQKPVTYFKFNFVSTEHPDRLANFGVILLLLSVGYFCAQMSGLLSMIPSGLYPVVRTFGDAAGVGGGLLCGYFMGLKILVGPRKVFTWFLLIAHCIFTSSNYTLFPVTALIISVSIGIFLGRGRIPVVMLVVVSLILGFFNLSKFEMRSKYWMEGTSYTLQELSTLPLRYQEWAMLSFEHVFESDEMKSAREIRTSQRISDRINNLVNLLDAQAFVTRDKIPVLGGETYTVIPVLLIPRLLWPEKPRTHEGMVLLNVHFGKQTLEESFVTYISWGLLPEAYGNFGPFWGALFCGGCMGLFIGFAEAWSRGYPLISLQSMLFVCLLVQFGSSFEMVASVWITSIFQMLMAIVMGTFFFVTKTPIETGET